ncbi:hypothetical protein RSOLAG22IIIB_12836 [Rhizoctonia solani]|uniref:Phosphatidylinositol-specific phospholipase C X domain-containing protein n=1 Tax=Rhizoctonia solani TaxID=456999 RepID=A0A0K6GGR6_9AGAM|nr:hypothetical protein RSOLAG22IIIB_12836 [Rhizoctonia solani]
MRFSDQLLKGIRYFDLRITKVSGKFKFTHTLVSYTDIFTLLSPVESFMREHDKEVLILDCQHFYDMNDADCDQLLDAFHSLFGDLLCTSDGINVSQALFETYIKRNKRVLLIWKTDYANKLSSRNRSLVYKREETLKSEWPNGISKKENLVPFLLDEYTHKESSDLRLFVLQGILDVSNFGWTEFLWSNLLTYEADLNEYLYTHLLPQLNTGKGFIYMVDNVSHPDDEATKKIIRLNANLQ